MDYQFETSVQYLKGVGPQLGTRLESWGIRTLEDLIQFVPRAYQNWKKVGRIAEIREGDSVLLGAKLLQVSSYRRGSQRNFELVFEDDFGVNFRGRFFRQPFHGYFERFRCPQKVWVLGKPLISRGIVEFHHPDLRDPSEVIETANQLVPVYTETAGLNSRKIHKLVEQSFQLLSRPEVWQNKEYLPAWICQKYELVSRQDSLRILHFPSLEMEEEFLLRRTPGHRRLIFEDFFWMEFTLAFKRQSYSQESAHVLPGTGELQQGLRSFLPFSLTGSQENAIEEIAKDLGRSVPMNRLLQGDVGSGKTIVMFFAILQAIESGAQAALMAPTEILAEQHLQSALRFFASLNLNIALLTSKTKTEERRRILAALTEGKIHCLIGTHSLIEQEVQFSKLGLVVVDEQHRFGVDQRRRLQAKGISPHRLLVTATPIPRTLAMTAYGDLEVSLLREKPPGRTPISTKLMEDHQRILFMEFLVKQVAQGRQAYFVYPLVAESEKLDLKSATESYEKMRETVPQITWGLLHGKMKSSEKEQIMQAFRAGQIQVLVSTTVIEVGVDVPNAVIMVIEHAERFGLSQLHQLRGRVGRGALKSYCLFALGQKVSREARQRLELMCETEDGFRIAEADLKWRGPGEFLGAQQSGMAGFRWADLMKDEDLLELARAAVMEIFHRDPLLQEKENQDLKSYWQRLPWVHTS
jgi:ATP-dependent DNA helicase RecG